MITPSNRAGRVGFPPNHSMYDIYSYLVYRCLSLYLQCSQTTLSNFLSVTDCSICVRSQNLSLYAAYLNKLAKQVSLRSTCIARVPQGARNTTTFFLSKKYIAFSYPITTRRAPKKAVKYFIGQTKSIPFSIGETKPIPFSSKMVGPPHKYEHKVWA